VTRAKKTRKSNAKRASTTKSAKPPAAVRSPKAPAPTAAVGPVKAQAKRRQPSATAALRKDTTILQATEGPRAAWSASKPMFQKR
jgi:hypothetical protein